MILDKQHPDRPQPSGLILLSHEPWHIAKQQAANVNQDVDFIPTPG